MLNTAGERVGEEKFSHIKCSGLFDVEFGVGFHLQQPATVKKRTNEVWCWMFCKRKIIVKKKKKRLTTSSSEKNGNLTFYTWGMVLVSWQIQNKEQRRTAARHETKYKTFHYKKKCLKIAIGHYTKCVAEQTLF